MKKDLISQIEKEGHAHPNGLEVETTKIDFRYFGYEKESIIFNSLGYKNLTEEQRYDFMHAMEVNGFEYCEPLERGYRDYLSPRKDYWQPIIEKIKAEYDSQFTDPF